MSPSIILQDMKKIKVSEVFSSIQGESSFQGIPFFFIRLSACNLKCFYCDTTDIVDIENIYNVNELVDLAEKSGLKHVEITGGEPLLQDNVYTLIDNLIEGKYTVLIETNGTIDISNVNGKAVIIMDIKTPSSGMVKYFIEDNIKFLKKNDEVKFVVSNREDYLWSVERIREYSLKNNIIFSPVYKVLEPGILAEWILQDRINVKLQIQLHKYLKLK